MVLNVSTVQMYHDRLRVWAYFFNFLFFSFFVVFSSTKKNNNKRSVFKSFRSLYVPFPYHKNRTSTTSVSVMYQSFEIPVPRTPEHSGGLTRPKPGFNTLLTARRPRGGCGFNKMSVKCQIFFSFRLVQ